MSIRYRQIRVNGRLEWRRITKFDSAQLAKKWDQLKQLKVNPDLKKLNQKSTEIQKSGGFEPLHPIGGEKRPVIKKHVDLIIKVVNPVDFF